MSGLAGRSEESRLSLAGTQGKMGLAHMPRMPMDDGRLIPVSGAASTHIIKVSPLPRIHELEATCMDAAGRCGIDVPDCWHVDLQEAQLGSTRTIDDVHPSDFAMLARDLGIGARRMRALCNELAESLDNHSWLPQSSAPASRRRCLMVLSMGSQARTGRHFDRSSVCHNLPILPLPWEKGWQNSNSKWNTQEVRRGCMLVIPSQPKMSAITSET